MSIGVYGVAVYGTRLRKDYVTARGASTLAVGVLCASMDGLGTMVAPLHQILECVSVQRCS
jgi:hypothetical protein